MSRRMKGRKEKIFRGPDVFRQSSYRNLRQRLANGLDSHPQGLYRSQAHSGESVLAMLKVMPVVLALRHGLRFMVMLLLVRVRVLRGRLARVILRVSRCCVVGMCGGCVMRVIVIQTLQRIEFVSQIETAYLKAEQNHHN